MLMPTPFFQRLRLEPVRVTFEAIVPGASTSARVRQRAVYKDLIDRWPRFLAAAEVTSSPRLPFLGLHDLARLRMGRWRSTIAFAHGDTAYGLRGLTPRRATHFSEMALAAIRTSLPSALTRHLADLDRCAEEVARLSSHDVRQSQLAAWLSALGGVGMLVVVDHGKAVVRRVPRRVEP